jgi:hypothetical protein
LRIALIIIVTLGAFRRIGDRRLVTTTQYEVIVRR